MPFGPARFHGVEGCEECARITAWRANCFKEKPQLTVSSETSGGLHEGDVPTQSCASGEYQPVRRREDRPSDLGLDNGLSGRMRGVDGFMEQDLNGESIA